MTLELKSEREAIEFLKRTDRPIILSCSGGKDSTAVGLYLKENGVSFTPVFCDTGWEHPLTYEYIKSLDGVFGSEVLTVKNDALNFEDYAYGMESVVLQKKMFPNGRLKWCTNELKLVAYRTYAVEVFLKTRKIPINITGVRRGESKKRSTFEFVEEQDEATQIRPILDWTEDDVISIHQRNNVLPNPLYLKGATRVGCWPCIFANKSDIKMMAKVDPDRIDYLEELEHKVSEKRGSKATFFKKGGIREAVSWANGSQDGLNALFSDEELGKEDIGCFRWGMCEHNQ